ncbi:hypothetical protein [Phreatobacter sp.]|uniref:hypothetical protein n=1 Tax=Phreatobacter sp. TaxID=1966341 RepID=UPI003F6F909E
MALKATRDKAGADARVELEELTGEPPQQLISRLLTWAGVALFAMGAVIMAARSQTGAERIAQLFQPRPPPVQRVVATPPQPASDPLLVYETRRLADEVRRLAAEREALVERVAAMERTVGDVTASIPRQPQGQQRPVRRIEMQPPDMEAPDAPPAGAAAPASPAAAAVPPGSAPQTAPLPQPHPAAPAAPAQAEASPTAAAQHSTAMRTEFGVDIAGDVSIEALRVRWQQFRNQHGPILEGLKPVIAIQEGGRPGTVELRLIAGPLSNANAAARLCATLSTAGVNCKPAVFDGQRLAVR